MCRSSKTVLVCVCGWRTLVPSQAGESVLTLTGLVRHHAVEKEKSRLNLFTGSTSICRGTLAKSLLDKASRMPDVSVHYGCAFSKVDMGRR